MSAHTSIAWCRHTFNPWWGCEKVSPGCANCYAETFAKRTGNRVWGKDAPRRFFGKKHWNEPRAWNAAAEKAGERRRVFCASMADVFEDNEGLVPWRAKLWTLIDETPALDWLLLTKRPENVLDMVPIGWLADWPANVWMGITAEDQAHADLRVPILQRIPAHTRFVSAEPLLERIEPSGFIDWWIIGGESGPRARPCDVRWIEYMIERCHDSGTRCFVKQVGSHPIGKIFACAEYPGLFTRLPDGTPDQVYDKRPFKLRDAKGADWDEWPEFLRVREDPR